MPQYQLLLAASLVGAALFSAAVFYLYNPATGKIALHDFDEDEPELAGEKDPFDVTTPEDVIDGTPLNDDQFWQQVRARPTPNSPYNARFQIKLRKLVVAILFFLDVSLVATSFGWALASGDVLGRDAAALALRLLFDLYMLAVSIVWVTQHDVDTHWPTTVHLSALSGFAFLMLAVTAIVPASPPPATTVADAAYSGALQGLWYASLAISFVVFAICSTVPRGPPLHFPSERIYSEKTLATSTTHVPDNVCGLPSKSSRSSPLPYSDAAQAGRYGTCCSSRTRPR